MEKEEFKLMEREYNMWLAKHPKGDHNYKSFSHMRRSLEFAKYWNEKENKRLKEKINNLNKQADIISNEQLKK